ncbi:MAG: hypothetical protein IPQ08_06335 [Chitinophagaceae bacterium]|nr:hypothetical protein [Chitinophagaceae bacterium]
MKKILSMLLVLFHFMGQAQNNINSGLTVAAQQSVDAKQYKLSSGKHVPYNSSAEFLTAITNTRRHIGEVGYILNGSAIEIWQFVGGIADSNFVKVSSSDRNYYNDTILTQQPLYVDAGVKDTLKFNADSSGLVKNTFISGGNLYQVVNGDTSLVGGVGGSAGALTWLDVARNSFDIDENRSHLIYDSAINFELYKKHEYYCDFNVSTIDTLNGNNLYGSIGLYPGSAGLTSTGNTNSNFIIVNTDSVLISLNPDYNLNEQIWFYLKDTIAKLFNNRLIYETPPIGFFYR